MEDKQEIDLRQIFGLIFEYKFLIIFVILAFVIVGAIYAVIIKVPKYTATTKLVLAQSDVSSASVSEITTAELSLNDKLIATYKEIAKSSSVVRSVIDNLGLDMTEDELKSRISITAVTSTQILLVSYTDYDQDRVARITNEIADVFSKRIAELYKVNNISVLDLAETPTRPSNINNSKDILIFAAVGVAVACGMMFFIYIFKNTVESAKNIEDTTGLFVLAELPDCDFFDNKKGRK